MALVLNEEQQLLRDSAKTFLQESSPVDALRKLRDSGNHRSETLWNEMAEIGWTGIVIPEPYDGLDFGYVGAGILMEECGRTLASSPLLSSSLVCSSLVELLGSEEQKRAVLPAVASGELIMTLAINESARFDPAATAMTATADGDSWILDGKKIHVLDGTYAHKVLVVARTAGITGDENGLTVFMVDTKSAQLGITGTHCADNHIAANMQFNSLRVGADALLGEPGNALTLLEKALDIGAVCSASEMLGIAEEAFKRTIEYLKERKQFGVPVGGFQALQHRAAQVFCELDLSRSVILKALQAIDADSEDRAMLASVAKVKCGKTVKLAVNEAVQMHGGIGMTDDFDIGFFMKRAAAARQEYGDEYYHADRFAKIKGY